MRFCFFGFFVFKSGEYEKSNHSLQYKKFGFGTCFYDCYYYSLIDMQNMKRERE